ncbi:MAG: 6-carboxytetrahydropterin synthase [Brevinematales bacterium]|nr:6-carboxytetrahydropterin synthase [Brevinematales bacterium]
MKYSVVVKSSFSSEHRVILPNGELEPLHSHNFKVEACVTSETLDKNNMVIDFLILERTLNNILSKLNNSNLNENPNLQGTIPTAEKIAEYILLELSKQISLKIEFVRVYETDNFYAEVRL